MLKSRAVAISENSFNKNKHKKMLAANLKRNYLMLFTATLK